MAKTETIIKPISDKRRRQERNCQSIADRVTIDIKYMMESVGLKLQPRSGIMIPGDMQLQGIIYRFLRTCLPDDATTPTSRSTEPPDTSPTDASA